MDIWSQKKRSEVMKKIKGKDTKPEKILRSALFRKGFRFRIHRKDLPGKPDIVFPKYKTAVFVNGCFWHYHEDCREGRIPSTNTEFWKNKLSKNIERDKRNINSLEELGWNVIVVWECDIEKNLNQIISQLSTNLNNHQS
ncbi:very short patch repair endonuclease [Chryseobacterium sp. S-02]|uniref:very short patch repair endonuclease n=1 Tax=Chryseobacterium sp. S-02 TaxID=3404064 RepID=UPI003CF2DEDD